MKQILSLFHLIRIHQWIKNLSLFAAVIFTGNLFDTNSFALSEYFFITIQGFFVFCALSSASYVFNDLTDAPLDKKHPTKHKRPIASGLISPQVAWVVCIALTVGGLYSAALLGLGFFLVSIVFYTIHIAYTLWLKQYALWDIMAIATSFMLRIFAGEVLTGFHIPIMLTFCVIFLSLFIASCKRRSELIKVGNTSRPALEHYRAQLLDFYNSTFATGAIITYALFTFQAEPVNFNPLIHDFLEYVFPAALGRKWLMVTTLPLIIVGIMRYAQLIYEREMGEAPERIVTSDKTLIATVALWGLSVVLFTYIL
jgi:decaprenyl-phosphate phosphoribosyltransferase